MSTTETNRSSIINKVWSMSNVLRDGGVGYGDYLEQITYLLFLKMIDERNNEDPDNRIELPTGFTWADLKNLSGAHLTTQYESTLKKLSEQDGFLGQIYTQSQNRLQDPAILSKLISLIDNENWSEMGADVKGEIYEGLLEKNAEDTKSGAGQYFTPRALIRAIVECMRPEPNKTIADPAAGTGGFLLAAYDYIKDVHGSNLTRQEKMFLKQKTFFGNEIVPGTYRLALINMYLHGIGDLNGDVNITLGDALINKPNPVDYVLTNPPFGKKSSHTITNDKGEQENENVTYNRDDFYAQTSNKQLNFLQHIKSMLNQTGKAAVVLPDNVLFEGGAGERIRRRFLTETNLHTILRLPTGLFYAQGVKANVLFFDNRPSSSTPWTSKIWIYDYRTNINFTLKKNPLRFENLEDFIKCYNADNIEQRTPTYHPENEPEGRWRSFTYDEIMSREKASLDITWIKDNSLTDLDSLPDPDVIAAQIVDNLQSALNSFKSVLNQLER